MNYKNLPFALFIASISMLVSCSENNEVQMYEAQVTTNAPTSLQGKEFVWTEGTLTMREMNTGKETSFALPTTTIHNLPAGQYTASIEGKISYADPTNGEAQTAGVRGSKENITIKEGNASFSIDLVIYNAASSFVFSEIYCTGSLNAKGTGGIVGDKFFKIYNNSNTVQYADGLALLECVLGCTDEYTYTPDPRVEGFASQVVYVVPGSGKDYPVQPGESFVITDQASNHTTGNTNAIDMTKADFEWYDETDKGMDTDNPAVPNMDKWYSYSATIWTPNNQGNRAYALARIQTGSHSFLNNYWHENWAYVNTGVTKYKKGFLVPNNWILDAVNLSPSINFRMLGTSAALDKSYVSISDAGNSKERFGKSAQRKTSGQLTTQDGKSTYTVLLDTNDSANDFTVATVSYKK